MVSTVDNGGVFTRTRQAILATLNHDYIDGCVKGSRYKRPVFYYSTQSETGQLLAGHALMMFVVVRPTRTIFVHVRNLYIDTRKISVGTWVEYGTVD